MVTPVTRRLPLPGPFVPPADEPEELPTVSFSELALYEGCPLRYRFSTSLGFQPQLVTELGYGRAIHHILRHLAENDQEEARTANGCSRLRMSSGTPSTCHLRTTPPSTTCSIGRGHWWASI